MAEAERQHGLRVAICPVADRARYRTEMADAEVLWHLLDPVSDAVLEAAPALRLVQKIGVGVNTIDLEAARRRGVAVCNMPGTNTQAVAEMTLLLILAALRRVARLDAATRAGEGWRLPAEVQDRYGEVRGRTVGLVGYGAVPGRLAAVLAALGGAGRGCARGGAGASGGGAAVRSRTPPASGVRSTPCSGRATSCRCTSR